jgi:hypothetical protein
LQWLEDNYWSLQSGYKESLIEEVTTLIKQFKDSRKASVKGTQFIGFEKVVGSHYISILKRKQIIY